MVKCYSTKLNLSKVRTNDIFDIDVSNVKISIKIDKILGYAVILTCSLDDFNQKLIISIKTVILQVVIINNILYFLLENKPVLFSENISDTIDIKSSLEFISDVCNDVNVLLLLNPKTKVVPYLDLSGKNWKICFHNKQLLDENIFILKEENIYYCDDKEELIKIVNHNDNVKYVIPY